MDVLCRHPSVEWKRRATQRQDRLGFPVPGISLRVHVSTRGALSLCILELWISLSPDYSNLHIRRGLGGTCYTCDVTLTYIVS